MKKQLSERITETVNPVSVSLDTKSTRNILTLMNREDQKVALAVKRAIPQITHAVDLAANALAKGGRLVYLGAGTSGRLGVLDAAECRPTFGTDSVVAILAGGRKAQARAGEGAEDSRAAAQQDLERINFKGKDVLVGLAASGRTPYTLEGLRYARRVRAGTVCVTANPNSPMERLADVAIVVNVGPEIIAGSTRLKAGTAEKLVLNMLSTAAMVRLGRVFSGLMVHMEMKNEKLLERGRSILVKATGVDAKVANRAFAASGANLPAALLMIWRDISKEDALQILKHQPNTALALREARAEYLRQKEPSRKQPRQISRRKS